MAEISGAAVAEPHLSAARACAACAGENTGDSRFCRHCGAALQAQIAPVGVAPVGVAPSAPVVAASVLAPQVVADAPLFQPTALSGVAPEALAPQPTAVAPVEMSAQEIDGRRSRQLLERARLLAEKGDKAAAILACRQAIALAPESASGYSMLGSLLERSGETGAAMVAYRKVLELAPDSSAERDSLQRLRATMQKNQTSSVFHFDAQELFATDAEAETGAEPVVQSPKSTPENPRTSAVATVAPIQPLAASPLAVSAVIAPTAVAPANAPVAPAERRATPRPPSAFAAIDAARTVPPVAPRPVFFEPTAERPSGPRWLRALNGERSFYIQTTPLLATATLSLVFLLWARGIAVSRVQLTDAAAIDTGSQIAPLSDAALQETPPIEAPADGGVAPGGETAAPGGAVAAPGVAAPGVAAPGAVGTNAGSPAASRTSAGAPVVRGNARSPRVVAAPRSPVLPRVAAAPPVVSSPTRTTVTRTSVTTNPFGGLRPVTGGSGASTPATPTVILPAPARGPGTSSPAATGGKPLSPASTRPGYVRVTTDQPGLAAAPARPENRARAEENAALRDARAGRTSGAIDRATASLDGGRDAGWSYQQRALLKLESGDNAGAANDFQSAITAYREQIARGTRVDDARRGIAACQSGLRLALSNGRG